MGGFGLAVCGLFLIQNTTDSLLQQPCFGSLLQDARKYFVFLQTYSCFLL
ncbi:hypothetical protein HMPREF9436_02929 [Faecalibacterium cf. prausnitzii KLE1255]|uniref:Uncharacterized protein n=1 Tax=Faecalibacterium cf. prausnitzii KLE1255 TaxID=748224 RepID=E2ZMK9_9FIRM|nr:hypothetical protein HMPREF9436_02929 [Faecalibacterium cf. prausnitzii KLE1255]